MSLMEAGVNHFLTLALLNRPTQTPTCGYGCGGNPATGGPAIRAQLDTRANQSEQNLWRDGEKQQANYQLAQEHFAMRTAPWTGSRNSVW
jgi:hypothetical protein